MLDNTLRLSNLISSMNGIAKGNRFKVILPSGAGVSPENLTTLCKRVNMPGKHIMTVDRSVGSSYQKLAYGYGHQDVNMGFLLTTDMAIKKYFEDWQQLVMRNRDADASHRPGFLNEYSKNVDIYQLNSKGESTYGVRLYSAYPLNVNPIEFSDDNESFIELTVDLTYHRWVELPATK